MGQKHKVGERGRERERREPYFKPDDPIQTGEDGYDYGFPANNPERMPNQHEANRDPPK